MTLARRLGLTQPSGYVPVAFTVTAFAAGIQVALIVQALGGAGYPPEGKSLLTWLSLGIIGLSALLNLPFESIDAGAIPKALSNLGKRRAVILEPYLDRATNGGPAATSSTEQTNGDADPAPSGAHRLSARVHSPLAAGPVVAPDEVIPVTVEAEPEALAQDLEVTFEIHGPDGTREVHRGMEGTRIVEGVSFEAPGAFTIHVTLTHPDADEAAKTLEGRVASYREEVGRLFESLKETMAELGLDAGPQSTPREVCSELGRIDAAEPGRLADLAVELEVALYGDEEIDRASYETVHTAIDDLTLERPEEVTG